jgi:hypothetical protein
MIGFISLGLFVRGWSVLSGDWVVVIIIGVLIVGGGGDGG